MSDDYSAICGITEQELLSQMQPDIEKAERIVTIFTILAEMITVILPFQMPTSFFIGFIA